MRTKTITRKLVCALSKDDLISIGEKMAETSKEIDRIEDEKKGLKKHREFLSELAKKFDKGTEERDITCTVRYNMPVNGKKSIIRMDSDETVEVLNMTAEELQEDLFTGGEAEVRDAHAIVVEEDGKPLDWATEPKQLLPKNPDSEK